MRILIIPDVHGRDFWMEPCSHIDDFDKVVFLGDYHDPYPSEVSERTSRHRLRDRLVPFVEGHRDKVVCIYGNHDTSYLMGTTPCRYDRYHAPAIRDLLIRLQTRLVYVVDNYIFTHSGILVDWLERNELSLQSVLDGNVRKQMLDQISVYRGGDVMGGSPIWGDIREFVGKDIKHIPGYYQIFGHTRMDLPTFGDDFACLDCSKAFILDTETGALKEFSQES